MKSLIYSITAAIIALPVLAIAQTTGYWDSGLEVENHKRINVVIEGLKDEHLKAGLSKKLIRAKVELQLRQNGINPNAISRYKDGYLCVNVNIVGSAYNVDVKFMRKVTYSSNGRTYETIASVWETGGTGTYGRDSSFILQNLQDLVDILINDYIKANQI